MLELKVPDGKKLRTLRFEHSLLSVSKWEEKYLVAFQGRVSKSPEQMVDYFGDMLLTTKFGHEIIYRLSPSQQEQLTKYINESRTASSVPQEKSTGVAETRTSELMYYWMAELGIPFQPTETWHLSRCLMLIQLTAWKKAPPKRRKPHEVMSDWRKDNERNKQILGIKD